MNFLAKLTSRKLWLAIAGMTAGIATMLGISESEIAVIAGAVTTLGSAMTYIIMEGKIDATAVNAVDVIVDTAIEPADEGAK